MWWPPLLSFNPFRPSYQQDPYPSLARLRSAEPVARSQQPDGWVLTRHDNCRDTLRDNVRFSNDPTRGNAVLTLLKHPEQWQLLRDQPDLVRHAVVETLRWDSATHVLLRFVIEQHLIGRRRLEPGDTVFVNVAAAHRDPELFDDPNRFDITRETDTGDILSFGIGPHFCLGQPLALIQADELLSALAERLPNLALARDGLNREQDLLLRGPQRLQLTTA